jgi:hypothetical protein
MAISEKSNSANTPAVRAENTANGPGVFGKSRGGRAVEGLSDTNYGVIGDSRTFPGVRGTSQEARGVEGWSINNDGVWGLSKLASGVHGIGEERGTGVVGESKIGRGVHGISDTNYGVIGDSRTIAGVRGTSAQGRGVEGWSTDSEGVVGISTNGTGVWGQTEGAGHGVVGTSKNGVGVYGKGGRLAAFFDGVVEVTGDLQLTNADCAEDFDIADADSVEPGTVMVLGDEGALYRSRKAYDKRVAGVVSGAGDYKPGIVLDKQQSSHKRQPIALLGKVFCKVDAQFGAISVGDLLTTSPTPGYAMRVEEPLKAFGAVIGKALRPLTDGQGLIPILIALQ